MRGATTSTSGSAKCASSGSSQPGCGTVSESSSATRSCARRREAVVSRRRRSASALAAQVARTRALGLGPDGIAVAREASSTTITSSTSQRREES